MPKQPSPENPLKGKNIPPAPPVETVSELNGNPVESYHGNMVKNYQSNIVEQQTVIPSSSKNDEERATIELSLYLRPHHDDKLEDLRQAYRKRTGKKITANELMRRLIDHATLDDILRE
jgi:hypothetical protein